MKVRIATWPIKTVLQGVSLRGDFGAVNPYLTDDYVMNDVVGSCRHTGCGGVYEVRLALRCVSGGLRASYHCRLLPGPPPLHRPTDFFLFITTTSPPAGGACALIWSVAARA